MTLEMIRDYAEQVAKQVFGRSLGEMDTVKDARLIALAFFHGNRLRYQGMGIDISKWPKDIESDLKISPLRQS